MLSLWPHLLLCDDLNIYWPQFEQMLSYENWLREPKWGTPIAQNLLAFALLFIVIWIQFFFFFFNAGQYFGPVFCKVPTLHFDKDAANPTPRGWLIKWPLPSLVVLAGEVALNDLAADEADLSLTIGLAEHKPRCGCSVPPTWGLVWTDSGWNSLCCVRIIALQALGYLNYSPLPQKFYVDFQVLQA